MKNNEYYSAKSKHGNSLNERVKKILLDLLENKKIKDFKSEPR